MNNEKIRKTVLSLKKYLKISVICLYRFIILVLLFGVSFVITKWLAEGAYEKIPTNSKDVWPWLKLGSAGTTLAILFNFLGSFWTDLKEVLKTIHKTITGVFNKNCKALMLNNFIQLFFLLIAVVFFNESTKTEKQQDIEIMIKNVRHEFDSKLYREVIYLTKNIDKKQSGNDV